MTQKFYPCLFPELILTVLVCAGNAIPNGVNGIGGHVGGVNGHSDGVNGHAEPGSQPKPSLRLSFSEYKRISNLLVLHLRRAEEGKQGLLLHSRFFQLFY